MRLLFSLFLLVPGLAFAERAVPDFVQASLQETQEILQEAVRYEPTNRRFQSMLQKVRRVRINSNPRRCNPNVAAYVNGGNTINICPPFYGVGAVHVGAYLLLHELAHLTTPFSFGLRKYDGECMADYVAYDVLYAAGAPSGPSGYDQRCGGSSRDWRPGDPVYL